MKTLAINRPKRVSLIEQTRIMNESQISTICSVLGWTEQQYCEHQFMQYEAFLNMIFENGSLSVGNKAKYSPIFRGFWNNQWMQRNEEFLKIAKYVVFSGFEVDDSGELIKVLPPDERCIAKLDRDYRTLHDAKKLIVDHCFMDGFESVFTLIYRL